MSCSSPGISAQKGTRVPPALLTVVLRGSMAHNEQVPGEEIIDDSCDARQHWHGDLAVATGIL
jgi:hypothetical protein